MKRTQNKSSRPNRAVRALRDAMNKTQADFARRFGVSESYIQAIETGYRHLTPELAERMMILCGVNSRSLLRGDANLKRIPIPPTRRSSLSEHVSHWQKIFGILNENAETYQRTVTRQKIEILVEAAKRKEQAPLLLMQLDRWIEAKMQEFKLPSLVKHIVATRQRDGKALRWVPYLETSIEKNGAISFVVNVANED